MVPPASDTPIQLESLTDADHEPPLHPLGLALTVNVVEPPLAGTWDMDVGLTENVQVSGGLTCNASDLCAVLPAESRTMHTAV